MIAQLRGILVDSEDTEVVIDCSGVGYLVSISTASQSQINDEGEITLFTHFIVREDAQQLFGFATKLERTVFRMLLSINGISGRIALAILSSISLKDLQEAISTKNPIILQKIPGVGKKLADRMLLELRDKILTIDISSSDTTVSMGVVQQEVVSALGVLGYQRTVAEKAIKQVMYDTPLPHWTVDSLLRATLSQMNNK